MVRPAQSQDLPAILAITNREIIEGFAHFATAPVSLEDLLRELTAAKERYPWLVAQASGVVVGFAKAGAWKAREAYAWSAEIGVYVAPENRGRGIGKALYASLFPLLESAGMRCVLAGIALPNPASIRLHEAFGMRRAGTLEGVGFKLGLWRDVGYWQKRIGGLEPPAPLSLKI